MVEHVRLDIKYSVNGISLYVVGITNTGTGKTVHKVQNDDNLEVMVKE